MEDADNKQYAGFWMRFVALIIDAIVIQMLQYILIIPLLGAIGLSFLTPGVMEGMDPELMDSGDVMAIVAGAIAVMIPILALGALINILYYTLMECSKHQATLGKMAIGLQVTDMEGNRLDFAKALLRQLGKIVSAMIFYIGYIMAGLTSKKQALHDMMAGALVVRK